MASLKGPGVAPTYDGEIGLLLFFFYLLMAIAHRFLDRFWAPDRDCPCEMEHGDNWSSVGGCQKAVVFGRCSRGKYHCGNRPRQL